jgi:hypothetical protein
MQYDDRWLEIKYNTVLQREAESDSVRSMQALDRTGTANSRDNSYVAE